MKKFIRIDADNIGDHIELALLNGDIEEANKTHTLVQDAFASLRQKITSDLDSQVLMIRCDDILFSCSNKEKIVRDKLEEFKCFFVSETSFTISIGYGDSLQEALINLRKAKMSGKNKIVGI